jgi:aryl-alcohol dehydrogenase-like predicted oxidoreductase
VHRPDDDVPIADTLGTLQELVTAGYVREIGCSNFDGPRVDAAAAASSALDAPAFVSLQNQLSLLDRRQQDDTIASCDRHGLGILPYFPLASGMLTGKYQRGAPAPEGTRLAQMPEERAQKAMDDRAFDVVDRLTAFAEDRGHTLLQLAMSWLTCLPHMASVIAGATSVEQVRSNVAAAGWVLTDDEMAEVDRLSRR